MDRSALIWNFRCAPIKRESDCLSLADSTWKLLPLSNYYRERMHPFTFRVVVPSAKRRCAVNGFPNADCVRSGFILIKSDRLQFGNDGDDKNFRLDADRSTNFFVQDPVRRAT